jgi:hypothetical protein
MCKLGAASYDLLISILREDQRREREIRPSTWWPRRRSTEGVITRLVHNRHAEHKANVGQSYEHQEAVLYKTKGTCSTP